MESKIFKQDGLSRLIDDLYGYCYRSVCYPQNLKITYTKNSSFKMRVKMIKENELMVMGEKEKEALKKQLNAIFSIYGELPSLSSITIKTNYYALGIDTDNFQMELSFCRQEGETVGSVIENVVKKLLRMPIRMNLTELQLTRTKTAKYQLRLTLIASRKAVEATKEPLLAGQYLPLPEMLESFENDLSEITSSDNPSEIKLNYKMLDDGTLQFKSGVLREATGIVLKENRISEPMVARLMKEISSFLKIVPSSKLSGLSLQEVVSLKGPAFEAIVHFDNSQMESPERIINSFKSREALANLLTEICKLNYVAGEQLWLNCIDTKIEIIGNRWDARYLQNQLRVILDPSENRSQEVLKLVQRRLYRLPQRHLVQLINFQKQGDSVKVSNVLTVPTSEENSIQQSLSAIKLPNFGKHETLRGTVTGTFAITGEEVKLQNVIYEGEVRNSA